MGTSPSKDEVEIDNNHSKDSKSDTAPYSPTRSGNHMDENMADTPRTNPRTTNPKMNGFEAQSRVDRQIGVSDQWSDRRDDDTHHSPNTDDRVHVNLAMADLMAYLQVVANNSNNLPLTSRDDPELGRMVSSLTTEEYARKSAAFIPADVRVIGGTFTKYGRVWDLPTSEEYNASDGAQEPGK
jgi:hypothetical protein